MASADFEIFSFVQKFTYMSMCGINANLAFSSVNANVSVTLQADLGTPIKSIYQLLLLNALILLTMLKRLPKFVVY